MRCQYPTAKSLRQSIFFLMYCGFESWKHSVPLFFFPWAASCRGYYNLMSLLTINKILLNGMFVILMTSYQWLGRSVSLMYIPGSLSSHGRPSKTLNLRHRSDSIAVAENFQWKKGYKFWNNEDSSKLVYMEVDQFDAQDTIGYKRQSRSPSRHSVIFSPRPISRFLPPSEWRYGGNIGHRSRPCI